MYVGILKRFPGGIMVIMSLYILYQADCLEPYMGTFDVLVNYLYLIDGKFFLGDVRLLSG